ncbi:MAG: hypothetical protein Q8P92_04615 [Candidatus Daviesbacteria bacterium]|nr:hypothetical protein [Candidatus Daviesbacteria bacterium]
MKEVKDIFGTIEPPDQLKGLVGKDQTGTQGLSLFLSQLVALIYVAAAVMLLFMLLWGGWDWMTSGGDKEKLAAARDKLIHALIGIGLFAAAFAIIRVIETAFGFKITPDI